MSHMESVLPQIDVRNSGKATPKRRRPRSGYGSKEGPTKIPFSTIQAMRARHATGASIQQICEEFGACYTYTLRVLTGGVRAFK